MKRTLPLLSAACLLLLAACSTLEKPETSDIVSTIPWTAPEEHTYTLTDDDKVVGETSLSIQQEGDTLVLTQRSSDDNGNVDEASVVVDAATLKPRSATRSITDEDQREVAVSTYEASEDCDSGLVVRIEEQVFDPPDETTPEIPRRAPLCVPEHSYDNDTSLFLWRTIPFEERYLKNYTTILTGTRRKQTVRIEVIHRTSDTPAGDYDSWLVQISADGKNQRAWFSAEPDHRLIAYQNDAFTFKIKE
ncbi:MAG: hypothetical protein HY873_04660 [Chloroflexi bacterium]|nr:hypothetical protein [Chloroflexota bacterium]